MESPVMLSTVPFKRTALPAPAFWAPAGNAKIIVQLARRRAFLSMGSSLVF
jgi:hypothetical protein